MKARKFISGTIVALLFLTSLVSALNLEYTVSTEKKEYTEDDVVTLLYNVTNREVSLTAEDVTLWIDLDTENISESLGNVNAGETKTGSINLGKLKQGGYLIDTFLSYSWFGIEDQTQRRSLSINVEYSGERLMDLSSATILSIEVPERIDAGEGFSVAFNIENEVSGAIVKYFIGKDSRTKKLELGKHKVKDSFELSVGGRHELVVETYDGSRLLDRKSKILISLNPEFYQELPIVELKRVRGNVTIKAEPSKDIVTEIGCFVKGGCKGDIYEPNVRDVTVELKGVDTLRVSAVADDSATGDSVITGCNIRVAGEWREMNAADGAFDSSTESILIEFATSVTGDFNVEIVCSDEFGNNGYIGIKTRGECLYECCDDTDCEQNEYCDSISYSCERRSCVTVLNSGPSSDKLDIVFVSDDYGAGDFTKFENDVKEHSNKILSMIPFSTYKSKINVFRVDKFDDLGCEFHGRCIVCDNTKVSKIASECPNDKIIVLVNSNRWAGCAGLYGVAAASSAHPFIGLHEFGHSFGGLWDEYSYGGEGFSTEDSPNCDSTPTCSKWDNIRGTGCYLECRKDNFFRSIEHGIMREESNDFGIVNIQHLISLLSEYK